MKLSLFTFHFLLGFIGQKMLTAQTLTNTGLTNCVGTAALSVSGAGSASKIQWYKGATQVSASTAFTDTSGITVAGGNGAGSAANQLSGYTGVLGVYVDSLGNVYVADADNNRIQKWAPGAPSGTTVAGGHGPGSAANQLYFPEGVYVDASGNLYAADFGNDRVQKWAPGATSGATVAGGHGPGSAANQLFDPTNVFIDATGNVYVVDLVNQRVQKWVPGATSGTTVAGENFFGSAAYQLAYPRGLYVDALGNVYVADTENERIQEWAPGATIGHTVAGGSGGAAANQLFRPYGVYVDALGNVYAADSGNGRIQKWAPGATSGITVAGGNGFGGAANQLSFPTGVFVNALGDIYVADSGNGRIQKWASTIVTTFKPLFPGSYTAVATINGVDITTNKVDVANCTTPTADISLKAAGLKIYPNPTTGLLTIQTDEKGGYLIVNLLGQPVQSGKTTAAIDVSGLTPGVYMIKIGAGQAKLMKQ